MDRNARGARRFDGELRRPPALGEPIVSCRGVRFLLLVWIAATAPMASSFVTGKRSHTVDGLGVGRGRRRRGLVPQTRLFPSDSNREARSAATVAGQSSLDRFLSLVTSEQTEIVLGTLGLLACGVLHFGAEDLLDPAQSRSELLGILATGSLLWNGLSRLDVTTAVAERVELQGQVRKQLWMAPTATAFAKDWEWTCQSLLDCTPARTVVVLEQSTNPSTTTLWNVVALQGIVPQPVRIPSSCPLLNRYNEGRTTETYLPNLPAIPGRVEFTYLPTNAQEALLLPVLPQEGEEATTTTTTRVVVLGSDRIKSFTPRDVAWCVSAVTRLHPSSSLPSTM